MARFVHLSDLHIQPEGVADPAAAHDTGAVLAAAIERIAALAPDFVVVSGDLANHGDAASYRRLAGLLRPLEMPVVLALGNHDSRPAFHAVLGAGASEAPHDHAAVLAGLHVITLDTAVPGRIGGAIDEAQAAWLAAELDRHPDLPKLIVAHHPPRLDDEGLPWASLDAPSTARLAPLLAGRRVAAILSGHVHVNRIDHWHGIPVVIWSGLHSAVDVTVTDALAMIEGAGFGLCRWRPSGLSATFVPLAPAARPIRSIDMARLRSFA
jgi:3',5'-cyclic AMP phosphodiesterase CpdA